MTIQLDEFGHESLSEEAERQGVTIETLVKHAAMYYLAELPSSRQAAKVLFESADSAAVAELRRRRQSSA